MDMNLNLNQTRVLGAMLEKEITTPDQYPLSLNALTLACNQKSNRDPVLQLDQVTVQIIVDELIGKRLVVEDRVFANRVVKYKHRFCNTAFGDLKFTPQELGIICVLFLRGPQTPGELRSRTGRLCKFENVREVELALKCLKEMDSGPFVVQLPREPGKRESRYAHLFSGNIDVSKMNIQTHIVSPESKPASDRLSLLENQIKTMQDEIDHIKQKLDLLIPGC
ncbi:DUF480 domain-containing protein [bacterium]|nr:DUF480 domain-containing protein [bacterium]